MRVGNREAGREGKRAKGRGRERDKEKWSDRERERERDRENERDKEGMCLVVYSNETRVLMGHPPASSTQKGT